MGSLRRSKTKQPEEAQCRRHPKHRQSPGVCSVCLGEKLSSLYSSGSGSALRADPDPDMGSSCCSSVSSSYSSYYSSSSSSSCSTPAREEEDRRWKGSSSMSFLFSGIGKKKTKNTGLIKSRSMDLVGKMRGEKIGNDGFWSKLLQVQSRSGGKSRGSATIREVVVVTG